MMDPSWLHPRRGGARVLTAALVGLLLASLPVTAGTRVAAPAANCPSSGSPPADITVGSPTNGRQLHIITGIVDICDPAAGSFEIPLPANLQDPADAKAQLALAGLTRRYGVHQTGFTLGGILASALQKSVKITFTATVDGLDRYELAYTLYLTAKP